MPTNLPPECLEAEKRYHAATSLEDKILCLEELLAAIPKHKGTDKLRADYRRRPSKLKSSAQKDKAAGRHESVFHIEKEGAGRAVLVGLTNTGKSALVAALTHATPEVSESPYTTWTPTPGMMTVEDVQIQLIDTPPLDKDHVEPELLDLIRSADLVLLVVDLQDNAIQQLDDTVDILHEHHILLRHRQNDHPAQQPATLLPFVVVVNKTDDASLDEDYQVFSELFEKEWPLIAVSAQTRRNFEHLKKVIFENLEIMRIYSKPPGKEADLGKPFIMKKGSTVAEFAGRVHKDFIERLKTARVWGSGVYDGQPVARDHVLQDGDIVELHL